MLPTIMQEMNRYRKLEFLVNSTTEPRMEFGNR
jgi:hypothetical protein